MRVWNKQDRLSVRARFDRPKAFRLSSPHQQKHGGGEKNEVECGDGIFGAQRPDKLAIVLQEIGTGNHKRMSRQFTELEESIDDSLQNESSLKLEDERRTKEHKKGGKGGGEKTPRKTNAATANVDVLSLSDPGKAISLTMAMLGKDLSFSASSALKGDRSHFQSSTIIISFPTGLTRKKMKQMQTDTSEQARVEREGMAVLKIKMADLFAVRGETVSVKMSREANNLKEFKVFVSLENRLMFRGRTEQSSQPYDS